VVKVKKKAGQAREKTKKKRPVKKKKKAGKKKKAEKKARPPRSVVKIRRRRRLRCCPHCPDYEYCEDRGECCEYCDYYLNGKCMYGKKTAIPQFEEENIELPDYRGDDFGIDDYEAYESVYE
jgi:ribosomal protein L19E